MKVIGIDVGTAITGWSVVSKNGSEYVPHGYGVIRTDSAELMSNRLKIIYDSLDEIIHQYSPDSMAVEDLFYFKNQKTVIKVGQARGVILLAGSHNNLNVFDYTPLQVKQSVCGYGRADKNQIQIMTKMILKLKEIPKPDDVADALAVSICHLNTYRK
jgi:crossover junction endodeoxyribonuclease RuvC